MKKIYFHHGEHDEKPRAAVDFRCVRRV
jgi:hypothetical protein